MTAVEPATVEQFESGFLRTRISSEAGGYRWTHELGRAAPARFSTISVPGRVSGLTLADNRVGDDHRSYTVGASSSVADRLLAGALADPISAARLVASVEQVGAALRALHDLPVPAESAANPHRGWRRLHRWTTGRAGTSVALHAAENVRTELGEDRWATIAEWVAAAAETDALKFDTPAAILHGAPGLGSMVVDENGSGVELLVGEDVTIGPRHSDLGWVLGEITELSTSCPGPRELWRELAGAVQRGYGTGTAVNRTRIDRTATLRIALHLHDFLAYVGWSRSECRRYCGLLRILIDGQVSR